MIKIEDRFEEVSWQKAIQFLKDKIIQNELSNSCALINPDSTTEELFLFQKLMRGLNINNIDHRIHSVDFRNQDSYETYPRLNENINDIKNKDVILLIDSNVSYDQPILSYHIRKAYKNNCKILSLNTYNYNYNFDTDYQKLVQPDLLVDALASIYVKLCKLNESNYKNINFEKSINLSLDVDPIVDSITNSNNLQIILGSSTISHPDYDLIKYLSNQIADILNIKLSILLNGCNTPGAWITGCVPHRKAGGEKINSTSLNFQECLEVKPDFTFLFNIEPDDTVLRNEFQKFLSGSKFVIGIQNFINEKDLDLYDVLLPLSTHYETSGSYINIEGKSQYFDKACDNLYDSKEGWKILTYLANNLDLNNFNYEDISDVQEEINSIIRKNLYFEFNFDSDIVIKKSLSPTNSIRYGNFHHYFTNAMLRRASSLLKTIPKNNVIKVNNKTLQLFDVNTTKNKVLIKQKDKSLLVDLLIDENVSDNCVYITTSSENYYDLGNNFENIVIEKMFDNINIFSYIENFLLSLNEIVLVFISIIVLITILLVFVAYYTYAERKVIAAMQIRKGPNVVGPYGLLQPLADGVKLFLKEIIIPTNSNTFLFLLAPIITFITAFSAWAVIPFSSTLVISDINAGLLYILALTSMGVYGIIIAGWASNSKYALLGAMRSAAQIVAYEIAMGFALVGVVMITGSLNLGEIIDAQKGSVFNWLWLPLLPLFIVYVVAGVAETNRAPFDVAEGESELVAGFHVEYSGMAFAIFFIAEYANMILISALIAILFFGGWLSPFTSTLIQIDQSSNMFLLNNAYNFLVSDGIHWFIIKTFFFMFTFIWFRATFPRYRYDQIMRLGWKILIPITLFWIMIEIIAIYFKIAPWFV